MIDSIHVAILEERSTVLQDMNDPDATSRIGSTRNLEVGIRMCTSIQGPGSPKAHLRPPKPGSSRDVTEPWSSLPGGVMLCGCSAFGVRPPCCGVAKHNVTMTSPVKAKLPVPTFPPPSVPLRWRPQRGSFFLHARSNSVPRSAFESPHSQTGVFSPIFSLFFIGPVAFSNPAGNWIVISIPYLHRFS